MGPETTDTVVQTIATVGAVLSAIVAMVGGLIGLGIHVWRTKIKPQLEATRKDARVAAHEVLPNSGKSLRDAVDGLNRTVEQQGQLLIEIAASSRAMREDQSRDRATGERVHSEIFRRLHEIETPNTESRH